MIDRLLIKLAERRGYTVVGDSCPVGLPTPAADPDVHDERVRSRIFKRRIEHIDAMAESLKVTIPQRENHWHVDL